MAKMATLKIEQILETLAESGQAAACRDLEEVARELEYQVSSYQATIDAAPSIIFAKDLAGRYLLCNKAFASFIGKKPAEIIGKTAYDLLPKPFADDITREDQKVLAQNAPASQETMLPVKAGERWYFSSLSPIFGHDGKACGVAGIVTDIHEQKLLEERLKSKQERLNSIIATTTAVFYTRKATDDFRTVFISPNITKFGYTTEEFTRNPAFWSSLIHPDDLQGVMIGFGHLYAKGSYCHEYRFKTKDGQYVWLRDEFSLTRDESGNPLEINGFWSDITGAVALRNHFEVLSHTLEKTAIVATTDLRGKITYVNDKFCEISGYAREELLGKDHRIVNSGYHSKDFFRTMWQRIKSNNFWQGEVRNKRKDGSYYWVNTTVAPLHTLGSETDGYIAIRFDITAEKVAQERLVESAKLSTLGEMAGGIAHEILNPLAAVHGKVRVLKKQMKAHDVDPDRIAGELSKIEANTKRIEKIIKGLRTFSRNAEKDPMEKTKLAQIIADTVELCQERFKNHLIDLRINCDDKIELDCRPSEISQILLNLLGNAHDAVEAYAEKWVALDVRCEAGLIQLSVTDSGDGIPDDVVERMMQPFFTTKKVGKGTGLGLSISRAIAEGHRGTLAYDASCKNTRFVLELPITHPLTRAA